MKADFFKKIKNGLIVSCQALKNEPLYSSEIMAKMALAASLGGACAIRANTPEDISAIKKEVSLPIIGLYKKDYEDSEMYITPTIDDVAEVVKAGATVVAADFTDRIRPHNVKNEDFISEIKKRFPDLLIMADISTFEEGEKAYELGVDMISTTLSGYTPYSPKSDQPDFLLLEKLVQKIQIPIICEGRLHTPEQASKALEIGAFAIVVGGAITRPLEITKRFSVAVEETKNKRR